MYKAIEEQCYRCGEKMETLTSVTAEIIEGIQYIVTNVDAFVCPCCGEKFITDGSFLIKRRPFDNEEWNKVLQNNLHNYVFN